MNEVFVMTLETFQKQLIYCIYLVKTQHKLHISLKQPALTSC